MKIPTTLTAPRAFAAFWAVVAIVAGVEWYALARHEGRRTAEVAMLGVATQAATTTAAIPDATAKAIEAGMVGWVDEPMGESVVSSKLRTSGWALAPSGVQDVEISVDGRPHRAQYGLPRNDVPKAVPGYPNASASGFSFEGVFGDPPLARRVIEYSIVDKLGGRKTFGRKSLIPPAALAMWAPLLDETPARAREHFWFLMMLSGVTFGGAAEVDVQYKDYVSRTQKIGISVPILYMRTTDGIAGDWRFAADFDLTRKCGTRLVAEDSLASVIDFAVRKRIPVQFILNGGIWGDASCDSPEWDLNDNLEQDPANCQWTQSDHAYPDNYLKGHVGSTESPELARTLTYNVYASKVRHYKKRNLQAAARVIAAFAHKHPDLFVGVALDSDTYMNPFFLQKEIFDYNPGMLRQFREWLRGTGAYAGVRAGNVPDLSAYRRAQPLTLAKVNKIARQQWKSFDDVQPPRKLPGSPRDILQPGETPFWDDPWWQTWDAFRKHIIDLHYDELSTWAFEAGMPRDKIFSAQGFIRPDPGLNPFAIRIFSHTQNYDSAGVSVEGAIPKYGHLGAVIYGEAARNDLMMDESHSMFATFGRMDPGWAIVEYNSTDLKRPNVEPEYAMAYRTFRDAFNYGARQVSAMAWNGSNGLNAGKPGYAAFTAWRNTQPEQAMLDFLVSHADVPWGARLWTFGSPVHTDDDGWATARGMLTASTGYVTLTPDGAGVVLLSPADQVIRPQRIERLLMRWEEGAKPVRVAVAAQLERDSKWHDVGTSAGGQVVLSWPPKWRIDGTIVERLKVDLTFAPDAKSATLSRVLLYPRAPAL